MNTRRDITNTKSVWVIDDHPLYGDALAETLTRLFSVQQSKIGGLYFKWIETNKLEFFA